MAGVRYGVTFDELVAYRAQPATKFRTRPPAVVEGPIGAGHARSAAGLRARQAAHRPAVQVHAHRPAHAGEDAATTLTTRACRNSRWRSPTRSPRRCAISTPTSCRSTKRTCRAARTNGNGPPQAINRVLDAVKTDAGRASVLRQLRRPVDPERHLGAADRLSQRAACRSHRDGDRAPPGGRARGLSRACGRRSASGSAWSTSNRPRSRRADQIARAIERAEKVLGAERINYVHPDCGFWMLKRNIADGKMRALVAGRDRYEGLHR